MSERGVPGARTGTGTAGSRPVLPERPGDAQLPPHLDPRGPARRPAGASVLAPGVRRRRWRPARLLSWIALLLSVALFAVAGIGYALYRSYDGNITRIPGLSKALPGLARPAAAPHSARNILLVGSDSRASTGDEFQGKGASYTTGERSDTVILAHLYGDSDQAQLISFPRDAWVTIPAFTDPKTGKVTPEHSAKLNSAIDVGGPALLMATIERLTDIRVDNYVQIDFAGFQNMVQALGGVQVCLLHPAKDSYSGINLKAGTQVIQGAQALAFVRQRHGLPNGDLDRIKRQQAFIASITRKVLSSGTLLDPFKLNSFLSAATKSVSVDDSLSASGLASLALRLKKFNAGGVTFTTVPVADIGGRRDGQDVVLLDETKDAALFAGVRQDQPPGSPSTPASAAPGTGSSPLTVPPSAVRVSVLNGAGTAGLAGTASESLRSAGFVVTGTGNRGTGATGTVVRYGPTRADSARTLAAAVPGATLQADPSLGSTLELVVGSSFSGAQKVTVGASTSPSAAPSSGTASPSAGAPAVTAANDSCVD